MIRPNYRPSLLARVLVDISPKLRLLTSIIFYFVFVSCEKNDRIIFELGETEIDTLFNNNPIIEGNGMLTLRNEKIEMPTWTIRRDRVSISPSNQTGFVYNIWGEHLDDYFGLSTNSTAKSGTYSFESLNASAGLGLETNPPCSDDYGNNSGTLSINFTRSAILVSISYLGNHYEWTPISTGGCSGRLVSSDSHLVEVELNFPLNNL